MSDKHAGDLVFVGTFDGHVLAYNAVNGNEGGADGNVKSMKLFDEEFLRK